MDEAVYDRSFFDQQVEGSLSSARTILPILFEYYRPTTVIDVGCGRGAWLRAAVESGVKQVLGIDGDYVERATLLIDAQDFQSQDLRQRIDIPRRFGLAISIEVAEHLPFHRSETFVADLTKLSDVILFSAALPYQGGIDHINEQWLEFWAILFRRHGYVPCDLFRRRIWGNNQVEFWYTQNIVVFCVETLARDLFPPETIATDRPLSFPHPLTFIVNVTRHRPLASHALDFECEDYRNILGAYLSDETTLPLMKMLDATVTRDAMNVSLFPQARTQVADAEEQLAARSEIIRQQSSALAAREEEIRILSTEVLKREEQGTLLGEKIVELGRQAESLWNQLSLQQDENLRKTGELQALETSITVLSDALTVRQAQITDLTQNLDQRDAQVKDLSRAVAEREAQIVSLRQTLDQSEVRLASLLGELAEGEAQLSALRQILDQRNAEARSLSQAILERDSALSSLLQSRSWKVTRPLRRIWKMLRETPAACRRLIRLPRDWWVIRRSGLFDAGWYTNRYPETPSFGWYLLMHYLVVGAVRGRDPHPLFSTSQYLGKNLDVARAGINALSHYLRRGALEGRDPNPFFDSDWYLNKYRDVAEAGNNPLVHYLRWGAQEGRDPNPSFDSDWYLAQYRDVAEAGINPLVHYFLHGAEEGRHPSPPDIVSKTGAGNLNCEVLQQRTETKRFAAQLSSLRHELAIQVSELSRTVTVIIPCHNYGEYVQEAVDSVLRQIYSYVDVIVVDDGSTDQNTLSVLAGMPTDRIRVHRQENQGLSAARNNGARLTNAEYLMFLDADDRLAPEAIALLLLELENNPDKAYAYPHQRFFGDQELVWACQIYNAYDILWRNHPTVCSLIRGSWFRNSPGYRSQMRFGREDWEYWVELSTQEGHGLSVPVPVFHHRRHGITMTRTAETHQKYLAATLRRLNEHVYMPEAIEKRKVQWRPTVSVVIPFYNRTAYFSETLNSLRKQSISDFEVIVVNDGSDDTEALALMNSLRGDPTLRIIDCSHRGVAAARNSGVAAARSEYVFFLDSDDLLEPTALEKLTLMSVLHPDQAFLYSGVEHFGDINGVCADQFDKERLLRENFLTVSCLIRRDIYIALGGHDETLQNDYEDYDLWLRFLEHGYSGILLAEPLFKYRRHSHSRTEVNVSKSSHEELMGRLRARHPDLYGGMSANRESWKLMKPESETALPITQAFSSLHRNESGIPYESWRLPNMPAPFQSCYWKDQRFRILYCIPFCTIGGAERVDLDILTALPRDRFRVTLVTMQKGEQQWLSRFNEKVDEIFSIPNFVAHPQQTIGLLLYLCFSRSIDLIFNRNTEEGYFLGEAIRKISHTVATADLQHLHDNGRDWVSASATYHDQLDARIVISSDLKRYAASTYALPEQDFKVIHNGIDSSRKLSLSHANDKSMTLRARLGIPRDAPVIGFVGRLTDQKDPFRWLEVAALVAQDASSVHFIIAGDGELRQPIEARIEQLNLRSSVHLIGYQDDVDGIYAAMTVLLLTSKYEGVPMVVLEAMLQGVPVISTQTGGTHECITDEVGTLVPTDASPDLIAREVRVLLDRIDHDPAIRSRCRKRIEEHFSLDRMQFEYRREFERLCARRNVTRRLADYETWFMTNLFPW